jgi:hypothetical protein
MLNSNTFTAFLDQLKNDDNSALIESIHAGFTAIYESDDPNADALDEGVFGRAKELVGKKDQETLDRIKKLPEFFVSLNDSQKKLYATDFVKSAVGWMGKLTYGYSGEKLPEYYMHSGLSKRLVKKLNLLANEVQSARDLGVNMGTLGSFTLKNQLPSDMRQLAQLITQAQAAFAKQHEHIQEAGSETEADYMDRILETQSNDGEADKSFGILARRI